MQEWRLYDAKNRLSELLNQALQVGPQRIRRHNDAVVVMAAHEFERLTGQKLDFKTYLMAGEPLEGLILDRDRSVGRDMAL